MTQAVNRSGIALALLLGTFVILSGCSPSHQDIQQWMNQQRQAATPRVIPLTKPVPFVPAIYTESTEPDAFDIDRLTRVLKLPNTGNNLLLEEQNRRKEPLEVFPLDAMTMVGSIDKRGQKVALIRVNKLIYQVRVGNYLGQDYGKVTKIMENTVELREIVQDSSGEVTERNTTLQLQESQEKSR